MSRKLIAFILVPLLFIGAFLFSNFLAGKKELPPQRPKAAPKNYVKVQPVQYQKLPVEIEAFGRVGSSQQINLVAEVSGRLERGSINLKEGQNFKSGQILARVNSREQRLNLQSRKSNYLNLFATALPDIKIDFSESYNTWLSYYNSFDIDKPLPELPEKISPKVQPFLASKGILTEYYAVKSLEENLRKYTLAAPYSGSILSVNLQVGSVVSPGSNIATIIRTDRLELKVPIQQKDIKYVTLGKKVNVVQEDTNESWSGTIARKADFIDPNTQSVNIYISIDNARANIYDGLYLKAIIPGKFVEEGMKVQRAVLRNKDEVFVVQDSVLKVKKVEIAQVTNSEAIISGLAPGELLVTDAPSNASNNMVVAITE